MALLERLHPDPSTGQRDRGDPGLSHGRDGSGGGEAGPAIALGGANSE